MNKAKKRFMETGLVHRNGKLVNSIMLLEAKRVTLEKILKSAPAVMLKILKLGNPLLVKRMRAKVEALEKEHGIILAKLGQKRG